MGGDIIAAVPFDSIFVPFDVPAIIHSSVLLLHSSKRKTFIILISANLAKNLTILQCYLLFRIGCNDVR